MSQIGPYVSENIKLWLRAVVLDDVTGAKDRVSWGESSEGRFSDKWHIHLLHVIALRNKICSSSLTVYGKSKHQKGSDCSFG